MNLLKPLLFTSPRGATRRMGGARSTLLWRWLGVGVAGITAVIVGLSGEESPSVPETVEIAGIVIPVEKASLIPQVSIDMELVRQTAIAPVEVASPTWDTQTVRPGDNLSVIFARAGFSDRDVYEVSQADGGRALRKIYPGEEIAFLASSEQKLIAVRHTQSRLKSTTFELGDTGFTTKITEREPDVIVNEVSLTIDSSMFLAGQDAGLSGAVIMDLAGIFGGVVDFALDPRSGDQIHVVHEQLYLDGEHIADGSILAASFTNRGDTHEAYRYTDEAGDTGYFNELGVSMQKAFLKAPLDFRRISGNFNPKRLHPIFKTTRPHRGTDYAADRGTPVYAAGDGKVIKAGRTKPNGNYVFIQHGESFRTHYLHLDKLKTRTGARVKQGEIIGTVGSTGYATGPHLHYEFLVNGVHRNPRTVHKLLPKAKSLPEDELPKFRRSIQTPLRQLAALRGETRLAMAE